MTRSERLILWFSVAAVVVGAIFRYDMIVDAVQVLTEWAYDATHSGFRINPEATLDTTQVRDLR